MRPLLLALGCVLAACSPKTNIVTLPPGVVELDRPMEVASNTSLRGDPAGTIIRAKDGFEGAALILCRNVANVRIENITLDGNREAVGQRIEMAPSDVPFARFYPNNGILAVNARNLLIADLRIGEIANFPILVSASSGVLIERVKVKASGSHNRRGRNNTTGGILLEEGTGDFQVLDSEFRGIRGNGVWTHSLYTSPRNGGGRIAGNFFERIGRDAIQIGHAISIDVSDNAGREIGFPVEEVDMEARAIPVAIDTAGNVENTRYLRNRFEEVNGKCIDLDGFHHGEVRENQCVNSRPPESYPHGNFGIVMNNSNPDMQSEKIQIVGNVMDGMLFGGIFVIGSGHVLEGNKLLNLNTAQCNENAAKFGCYYAPGEPDMLQSGIYLGKGAERPAPARNNVIRDNEISGFRMQRRCIAFAPGIRPDANYVERNICREQGK
ncbi:MAG: hypothetical protein WD696_10165 [Bryobacteraceae bacterium]